MRICILSRNNAPIGFIDNDAPEALHFYDDKLHVYLTGTAHTLEFTVRSDHEDADLLVTGNKLSFVYEGKDYYMTIMTTTETETELTVEAWSLSFELLNEMVNAYSAPKAMSFAEYITAFNFETSFLEVGLNEVSTKRITHEWTSDSDTVLSRLYSLATVFDAELEFVPVLANDYSLEKVVMNVYRAHSDSVQGIGQVRDDVRFRYGKGIEGITKTEDITELYTAIRPTGKDDLTLASLGALSVYDDDGNLEYYHAKGAQEILAPLARDQFPSTITEGSDNYICYIWSTSYETVNDLYGNALAKLKELSQPSSKYEIDGDIDTSIGDTVTIIDEAFNPPLYLETRVTEQEISFTEPDKNKTTFENTKELESQTDLAALEDLRKSIQAAAQAAAEAQAAADAVQAKADAGDFDGITLTIESSSGTIFDGTAITTTLTAHVYKGGAEVTGDDLTALGTVTWYKDGTQIRTGTTLEISDSSTATYTAQLEA